MLISHLKFAVRNLARNKMFSSINIAGLAVSITAFLLMALYIEDELSYDKFNVNAGRIYRVADDKQTPDLLLRNATSAAPVAPALQQDFPEILASVRLINTEGLIKYDNKVFEERRIFFADASIFKIFSFKLLKGNSDVALKEPASIVLTDGMAQKYFGGQEAIGKIISMDGRILKVTGVIDNVPAASHLQFDFLISMSTAQQAGTGYEWLFDNWYSDNFYTYILLPEKHDVKAMSLRLKDFDRRHREAGSTTIHNYALEKLTDIYLHSNRDNQVGKSGSVTNLYIFSIIALFMLLIACINFVNLSTARATVRAKEIAVKKVAGAARSQIVGQFFTESFLMSTISLVLAILLAWLLLPYFNKFSGKYLSINLSTKWHLITLFALFVVTGIISGGYPAFILSGFKPVTALKGKVSASAWSISIRKSLVIFQFSISVILIICSIVVYTQMNFLQRHDLGFKPDQTIVINFEGDEQVRNRMSFIKQRLLQIPGVKSVSASSNVPGDGNAGGWSMDFAKINGDTVSTELPVYLTDYSYLQQFNIPLVAGRPFSEQYPADSVQSMLLNETAVKKLGFNSPEEAIGVEVHMYPTDGKITGVFKDFHFESLQKPVAPLTMRMMPFKFRLLSIKTNTDNIGQTVALIEQEWKSLVPERPLEYNFLDDNFNKQYGAEKKFGQVFGVFTVLAIGIACLGLFGLALFSVRQRTKEVGIRKVLGAGIASIAFTLSKDFLQLVSVAIIIASPVAGYIMQGWLQGFAYRINISGWIFLFSGIIAVLIAMLTVSYQAIKAAVANPVKSLRTE